MDQSDNGLHGEEQRVQQVGHGNDKTYFCKRSCLSFIIVSVILSCALLFGRWLLFWRGFLLVVRHFLTLNISWLIITSKPLGLGS